jgi:hypothetical protein
MEQPRSINILNLIEAIVLRAYARGLVVALNNESPRCQYCGGSGQVFRQMTSFDGPFFVPEYCPSCYGNGIRAFQENDLIRYWQFEDALSKIIEQAKNPTI